MTELSYELSVSQVETGGDTVIHVAGEFDLATVADLRQPLDDVIDTATGDITVDLSAVTFLDSTALTVLVGAHQRAAADQRRLKVRNPSPVVHQVLKLTGLLDMFDVSRPPPAASPD